MNDQESIIGTLADERTSRRPLKVYRYRHKREDWKHVKLNSSSHSHVADTIKVLTWNLDFETKEQPGRISKALEYLQYTVFQCAQSSPGPCCLLFQEVTPDGFTAIRESQWVRDHFQLTPSNVDKWPGPYRRYGNVTLVERGVSILGAAIYNYGASTQERTAIEVDVRLRGCTIRVLNTHLESSGGPQPKSERERQLKECGMFLKRMAAGGLIVGDLNPIDADFDAHARNLGLRDAGDENGELGHTWGDQKNDTGGEWPNARLDRILCWIPEPKTFKVKNVERVAIGLRYEKLWVSDHFALMADIISRS